MRLVQGVLESVRAKERVSIMLSDQLWQEKSGNINV